jgi:hypothetical protein
LIFVVQDVVSPANMAAYEAGTKAFMGSLAMTPQAADIQWTAVSGPEFGYYYVVPMDGWADIGEMYERWEAAGAAMGQKRAEHTAAMYQHVEESVTMVIMSRPDLSHNADRAALTPENAYRHYTWWYPQPDKTQEAEAVAKEYIDLFKARGLDAGWLVYQTVMGTAAPDQATYNARDVEITKALGEDGMKLNAKAMSLARRMVISEGWLRPDLSFPPAQQQMGAR